MRFDLIQIISCQGVLFPTSLIPWQFHKCHETHFRREWDDFTYNKQEVAASLGQNNGHYPALPASLANWFIYLYILYCSMVNQACCHLTVEYQCTTNCSLCVSSSQELLTCGFLELTELFCPLLQ